MFFQAIKLADAGSAPPNQPYADRIDAKDLYPKQIKVNVSTI
jgi:hypothetical protein